MNHDISLYHVLSFYFLELFTCLKKRYHTSSHAVVFFFHLGGHPIIKKKLKTKRQCDVLVVPKPKDSLGNSSPRLESWRSYLQNKKTQQSQQDKWRNTQVELSPVASCLPSISSI